MDLIRELMLKLEGLPIEYGDNVHLLPEGSSIQIDGYDSEQVAYHLDLIKQAGFIEPSRGGAGVGIMFSGLSWAGHDFIDSVLSPEVWTKTKVAAAAVGGFTVSVLVESAKAILKQKFMAILGVQP